MLRAHLLLNASTRSGAVAEVEHASVPPGTTWFHVRPATPPPPKPDGLLHSLWHARTAPKPVGQQPQGVQQIPFGASCEFAAAAQKHELVESESDTAVCLRDAELC